ncbi:MAG: RNA degradosome polyphosphate kinase [Rhodospirillaceae bacterium]|nr:RNA degradosome polyphosphate kinase [Rhodospirillaceae bacterium]|tara:strand:+ start:79297 stop:81408 length:2112 start_codon:yes stop_codon:yes gene_type:complete
MDIIKSSKRFLNRELSWLAFNRRVLDESTNIQNPLMERIKFLSISAENLDEFFMVRVAGLWGQVQAGISSKSQDGLSPNQQYEKIWKQSRLLIDKQQHVWGNLIDELKLNSINVLDYNEVDEKQKNWLEKIFLSEFFPLLTPIAIDPAHPFPFLPNKGFGIVMRLKRKFDGNILKAIIPIPRQMERFINIPGITVNLLRIETLIELFLDQIFPNYELISKSTFTVIRDSDIEIEEEAEDLAISFENVLKRRKRGTVIRLMVENTISSELAYFLAKELDINNNSIVYTNGILALEDTKQLTKYKNPNLVFEQFYPRFPQRIGEFNGDCFAAIMQKDIIVHHPYESFDVVIQFIKQAAEDENVVAIKQTLYRTSNDSPIVKALIEAAEKGKSVTALIELKARFDEEANIRWARDMEKAGVHVVYGFLQLKTHAKVSLVIRREKNKLKSYVHFGTGNYHPVTAKVYTDLSFFTVNDALCRDAAKLFNYLTGYAKPKKWEKLDISPITMREKLIKLIKKEVEYSKKGKHGEIWAKMNSLVDPEVIDELYLASQSGVRINLIIRGICCLRPGIKGFSDNIYVKSIVGRFLEHSRIVCFGNGKTLPSSSSKVFISSADWMPRNLDRRVETLIPIENSTVHQQILSQIMVANLKDNAQSWKLDSEGNYKRISNQYSNKFAAHDYFINNPSLSGRGKSLNEVKLPELELDI